MSISGEIVFRNIEKTLWIKRPDGTRNNQAKKVFVLNKDETLAKRKLIEFGESSDINVQILSGIEEGDQIILNEFDFDFDKGSSQIEIAR